MNHCDAVDQRIEAALPEAKPLMELLRRVIRENAPEAEECISYSMPAYRHKGMLVYFDAFKGHVSFFPGSSELLKAMSSELEGLDHNDKGTIRFKFGDVIPEPLIAKMVLARVAENEARAAAKPVKPARSRTKVQTKGELR